MNNFGKRAISGFLFVVILTACIYIHPFCFFALFFIINIIGLLEFSHMAEVIHIRVNRTMCILSGSLLFISGLVNISDSVTTMYPLIQNSFEEIKSSVIANGGVEGVTYSSENKYTSVMILKAIENALDKCRTY